MSVRKTELLDIWPMVAARGRIGGQAPLAGLVRLQGLLADTEGQCDYVLEFGRDMALSVAWVELTVSTALPLVCQRSLQRFLLPVALVQRLGLVRDEAEEAALAAGYEPLQVPADGRLRPLDLVEDELILAVPVVPMAPGSQTIIHPQEPASHGEPVRTNPFAALAGLKKA